MKDLSAEDRRPSSLGIFLLLVLAGFPVVGCGDNGGTPPIGSLRFGQIGEIRVSVAAPLLFGEGEGEIQQILTWGSSGAWVLREQISYRGLLGAKTFRRSTEIPGPTPRPMLLSLRSSTKPAGLELFIPSSPRVFPGLSPGLDARHRLHLGSSQGAGSQLDPVHTRDSGHPTDLGGGTGLERRPGDPGGHPRKGLHTGSRFTSAYLGSVPFGTLDRADDSGARLGAPMVFLSVPEGNPQSPTGWEAFWQAHRVSLCPLPRPWTGPGRWWWWRRWGPLRGRGQCGGEEDSPDGRREPDPRVRTGAR
jgi:hypothetical protein